MTSQIRDFDNNKDANLYQQQVQELAPDHHYRTEIPNIVFELDISTTEFKVYCYLKKVAGDYGASWQSRQTIAEYLKISIRSLDQSLETLSNSFELLGNRPLIHIQKRIKDDGSKDTSIIHITPIWRRNGDYYRNQIKEKNGDANSARGVVQKLHEGSAKIAHKEDPLKKIPLEEITPPTPSKPKATKVACVCFGSHVKLKEGEYEKLCSDNSKEVIDNLITEMNDYCQASKPKGYIDYAAALRQWIHRRKTQPKPYKDAQISNKDKVLKRFKHYERYNGALCFIDELSISFQRGQTHYTIRFNEKGFEEQLANVLRKLDISC